MYSCVQVDCFDDNGKEFKINITEDFLVSAIYNKEFIVYDVREDGVIAISNHGDKKVQKYIANKIREKINLQKQNYVIKYIKRIGF